jgi:hypothetical protein
MQGFYEMAGVVKGFGRFFYYWRFCFWHLV